MYPKGRLALCPCFMNEEFSHLAQAERTLNEYQTWLLQYGRHTEMPTFDPVLIPLRKVYVLINVDVPEH